MNSLFLSIDFVRDVDAIGCFLTNLNNQSIFEKSTSKNIIIWPQVSLKFDSNDLECVKDVLCFFLTMCCHH